ncbi:MAG: tryptophan synthase subunit alpha, partial [Nitrosotalea sp.]
KIPLGVGFGVSNPDQARFIIKSGADAIIVGSAFLRVIENSASEKIENKIESFTKSLKKSTIAE